MSRHWSRRDFLKGASGAAAAAYLPALDWQAAQLDAGRLGARTLRPEEPDLHALAARAVEAAKSAGAEYADVRITLSRSHYYQDGAPGPITTYRGAGVRALVNGYWGFFGGTIWTPDEMARLGRGAVSQAKAVAVGKVREIDLGVAPPVTGDWVMPVKQDPFDVPVGEIMDFWGAIHDYAASFGPASMSVVQFATGMAYVRQTKVFASTTGSKWSQTTYITRGGITIGHRDSFHLGLDVAFASLDSLTPAGKGWEYITEANLKDQVPKLLSDAEAARHITPVEVGRYDMVFNAAAMAGLLDNSIGGATELDRAMGLEANASGTSFLNEPLEMLGNFQLGTPRVTVTANRSLPGGAATVKWDDDSITPEDFTIVKEGILVDFQTTREQAAWLAPYYQKSGKPIRSHGCASSESGMFTPIQAPPNLQLAPASESTSFEELVASTPKGIAVLDLKPIMDQQYLNGTAYMPILREIVKGKLGRFIGGGGVVFRSPDIWKNVAALGGPQSLRWFGLPRTKGQPEQELIHSVGAVPAKITNVGIIDILKKA